MVPPKSKSHHSWDLCHLCTALILGSNVDSIPRFSFLFIASSIQNRANKLCRMFRNDTSLAVKGGAMIKSFQLSLLPSSPYLWPYHVDLDILRCHKQNVVPTDKKFINSEEVSAGADDDDSFSCCRLFDFSSFASPSWSLCFLWSTTCHFLSTSSKISSKFFFFWFPIGYLLWYTSFEVPYRIPRLLYERRSSSSREEEVEESGDECKKCLIIFTSTVSS